MKLIALAFGIFIFSAFSRAADDVDDNVTFIQINGGYRASENFSEHDREISDFSSIAPKQNRILNASGADAQVVSFENWALERNTDGWVVTKPSQFQGFPAATRTNVEDTFTKVSASTAANVTVVYGDHGGTSGIALWGGDELSAQDVRSLENKISADTVVRAVHLHCYAGAAMVDPNRTVPTKIKDLATFIGKTYPKNRCSFGDSNEQEVGQYVDWKPLFDKNRQPTLQQLKDYNDYGLGKSAKDPIVFKTEFYSHSSTPTATDPTAMLTSDYFLKDVAHTLCADPQSLKDSCGSGNPGQKNISQLREASLVALCQSQDSLKKSEAEAALKLKQLDDTSGEADAIEDFMARRYLEKKFENEKNNDASILAKLDSIQAQAVFDGDNTQKRKKDSHEYYQLESQLSARTQLDLLGLAEAKSSPAFVDYLKAQLTPEWLEKNKNAFPNFSGYVRRHAPKSALELLDSPAIDEIAQQRQHKLLQVQLQQSERSILEPLIDSDPALSAIKENYASIKACENTPIN